MNLSYSKEWLTIANRALNLVGETSIQDFTGSGEPTQNVTIQLPSAVQQALSYHNFRCARKRTSLAPLLDAPAYGYKYAYQLPVDFVSLVKAESEDYSLENDKILSNDLGLNITYVAVPETPQALTPIIQEAIINLLAYKIAKISTMNDGLATRLQQEYQLLIAMAVRNDEIGACDPDTDGDTWWTDER